MQDPFHSGGVNGISGPIGATYSPRVIPSNVEALPAAAVLAPAMRHGGTTTPRLRSGRCHSLDKLDLTIGGVARGCHVPGVWLSWESESLSGFSRQRKVTIVQCAAGTCLTGMSPISTLHVTLVKVVSG